MSHDWQFSTVQDFLRRCNWQGAERFTAPSPPTQGDAALPPQFSLQPSSWHCQTVQTFLSRSNWDGLRSFAKPAQTETVFIAQPETSTHSATLTSILPVQQFFEFFRWAAQPEIAPVPKLTALNDVADSSTLNLSDLSDLF
jgi:hypothetical protein